MSQDEIEETRELWNDVADDWLIQVGHDGDNNRILNSDPVLWRFAGDVKGLSVLDAGCGTGYLTKKLHERGARATGIDFSVRMIEIAHQNYPDLDFRVDSCSQLSTVKDNSHDMVISNYVLMDTPDLEGTMRAFHRVLKPAGVAVLIFSHPCFPQGQATTGEKPDQISYNWSFSYFDQARCLDAPWAHFTTDFIWFHRPLSVYWMTFTSAGFSVVELDEPRVSPDRYHLSKNENSLRKSKTRPYSIAFKLVKNP